MYQYVSIDRIFTKVIRDSSGDFSESDIVEWCGEALEFIGAQRLYEQAVAFIEVKNYQCELPSYLHRLVQVARDNNWTDTPEEGLCPSNIVTEATANPGDYPPPACPVVLDCHGSPITDYELAYYRPYYDLKWEYSGWMGCETFRRRFTPVTLATGTFGFCLDDKECQTSGDQYSLILGKILRFNFEKGMVAVAFDRQVLDPETGYPMIPDHISYTTAITKYITMMIAQKDMLSRREGAMGLYDRLSADWQWYCRQASNVDKGLFGVDEHQNFMNQHNRLIPSTKSYYGFFGTMSRPEYRRFNDPDYRNKHRTYYGN